MQRLPVGVVNTYPVSALDDILDAAIAAWTARRVARDEAQPMPDPPQVFSDGIQSAIWA